MADLQCPKCGKPSRGVCAECHVKANPLAVKLETFRECQCGLTFFKGKWHESRDEMLQELAKKSIVHPSGFKLRILDVRSKVEVGKVFMDVDVEGSHAGSFFKRTVSWSLKPEKVKCDLCSKIGSGYYEATLQVRSDLDLDLDERQVAGIERTRGGLDYQIISADYAQGKVSDLISKGFLIVQSTTLFGKKNGKDTFRFYYSIKRPPFAVGDFIEHKGAVVRVRELAKQVKLVHIPSGKHTSATVNQLQDEKVLARSSDVRTAMVTSISPRGMQVMDTVDCHTHELPLREGVTQGQLLEYVKIGGKLLLLP
jgi:NMD protein affecting ribosome stability and mRNA decay